MKLSASITKSTLIFSVLFFVFYPLIVSASFSVSPPVIDRSGVVRDVVTATVTLTNRTERRVQLFAFVNNVSVEEEGGREEFETLRGLEVAESLANWVSVTRQMIELDPGEVREIDLSVRIHQRAEPGVYHAFISFAEGARRFEAEERISRDRSTLLSVRVDDDSEDILHLSSFSPERPFVTSTPMNFVVEMENRGDTTLTPEGEVIVFNSQGREIDSIPFNQDRRTIDPGVREEFILLWDGDSGWGEHRARIAVSYGTRGDRYTLNDTVFFTVLPIVPVVLLFVLLLSVVLLIANTLHRRHVRLHQSRVPQVYHSHMPVAQTEEEDDHPEHTIDLRRR